MLKAFKYRLYPDDSQARLLRQHAGCCRYVFNMGLEYRRKAYGRRGESRGYGDTVRLLNIMKKEKPWLREAYSQSLQSALRNLDTAYVNFFRDPGHFGYPNFKRKTSVQSIQYPQNCKVDFQEQKLYVPKIGWVPCIFHRRFEGRVKTVTISIEPSGEFHVSILVENEDKTPVVIQQSVKDESDVLGIDMGVKALCGSANRNRQRIKVAKVHKKIANQRKDTIEKATAEIAGKSHAAVAVENLNVKGMVKNHHLAKSVSDASMSAFLTRLETKCRNKGKTFVKVDRWFPSSQTCSVCGHVNKGIRDLKIREWVA